MLHDPKPAARVAYVAVRQLREEQGCPRGPVWGLLTSEEQGWYIRHAERAMNGLLANQIQDAWRIDLTELAEEGRRWRAAPDFDYAKRTHPELAEWGLLDERYRRRFFVIQMNAVAVHVTIPALLDGSPLVTALLLFSKTRRYAGSGHSREYHCPLITVFAPGFPRKVPAMPPLRSSVSSLPEEMNEPLLTPAEVATLFRVDAKTVTRWARSGKLTSRRTPGGHRRYLEREVRALLTGETPAQGDDS